MGKNKYTELDKLFQSKLKDGNVENGAWNNPTDDAFLAAMTQVKPEEEPKKKTAWWSLLFLLLIPILMVGIKTADEVSEIRSELNEIQNQVNVAKESKELTQEDKNQTQIQGKGSNQIADKQATQKSSQTIVEKTRTTKVSKVANTNPNKKSNSNIIKSNVYTSVNDGSINNNRNVTPTRGSEIKIAVAEKNPVFVSSEITKARIIGLQRIGGIHNLEIDAWPKSKLEGLTLATVVAEENTGFGKNLAPFAFADLNMNSIRMSGIDNKGFSLTGYDESQLGYELGIGVLQNVSKRWDIAYTASYRQVTNKSLYQTEFMFEEEDLITNIDGDLVYQLFAETQTPTGAYITNQDLTFAEQMDDETMMDAHSNIELFFNFVSFGVKPRFSLFQKDGLKIFAEAGINLNYLVHYCQSVDVEFTYEDKMIMHDSGDNYSMDDLNRMSFISSLDLGLEYDLGKHIFSSIKFGASKSLNSITASDINAANNRTYIDNLGISVSAGYRF